MEALLHEVERRETPALFLTLHLLVVGSGTMRPQIQLAQGSGTAGQNIQLLRSVVSQPGTAGTGQTTFLLAPQDKAKV